MALDITITVFLLVMAWRGYVNGAFRQLVKLVAIIAGYFIAHFFSGAIALRLTTQSGVPLHTTQLISWPLTWFVSALVLSFVLRWVLSPLLKEHTQQTDKRFGLLISVVKAGFIAYLLLCFLALYQQPLSQLGPLRHVSANVASSRLVAVVRRYNALSGWKTPAMAQLEELTRASKNPRMHGQDARALLSDPQIKAVVTAPEIVSAVERGDWTSVLKDERVKALLADPQKLAKLMEASMRMRNAALSNPPR